MTIEYPIIDRPTQPGWYWHRYVDDWRCAEVRVDTLGRLVECRLGRPTECAVVNSPGEWRGPIPEPAP